MELLVELICKVHNNKLWLKNNAQASGGGVYVNCYEINGEGGAQFLRGKILYNETYGEGGGVYVNYGTDAVFRNTAITGNTARVDENYSKDRRWPQSYNAFGGGIWICPTGSISAEEKSVAIFDNNLTKDEYNQQHSGSYAGDDLFSVPKKWSYRGPEEKIGLSETALGGGTYAWYQDGTSVSDDRQLMGRISIKGNPRYQEGNQPLTNEELAAIMTKGGGAFKFGLTEAQKLAALRIAENDGILIMGNVATRGGGIGSNGPLKFIAEEPELPDNPPETPDTPPTTPDNPPETPDNPPETPDTPSETPDTPSESPEAPDTPAVLGVSRPQEAPAQAQVLGASRPAPAAPAVLGARRVATGDEKNPAAWAVLSMASLAALAAWIVLAKKKGLKSEN